MVYIHNTAKSCNKIQSSQNMGEILVSNGRREKQPEIRELP